MTQQHPITPPPELVRQWAISNGTHYEDLSVLCGHVAACAAQWGADQEMEACCEWLDQKVLLQHQSDVVPALRAARRSKPPSLKEQALEMLEITRKSGHIGSNAAGTIRRALEQLDG